MPGLPTPEQMRAAAMWLRSYEDAPDEDTSVGLASVADYLDARADQREEQAAIREVASRAGVSLARARVAFRGVKSVQVAA